MGNAKKGDTVKINYKGRLEDGTVFASSKENEPLEFKIGEGKILPGVEEACIGMNAGETKTTTIKAADGFGPRRDELVQQVARSQFPEGVEIEVGQSFQVNQPDGQNGIVTVVGITDEAVTLDANHPLAGKDLTFDIELLEVA